MYRTRTSQHYSQSIASLAPAASVYAIYGQDGDDGDDIDDELAHMARQNPRPIPSGNSARVAGDRATHVPTRHPTSAVPDNHFDDGRYEFNEILLSWPLEDLQEPLAEADTVLPSAYSSAEEYFEAFKPLILEEARETLASGLEAVYAGKVTPIDIQFKDIRFSRNEKNPSTLIVEGTFPEDKNQRKGPQVVLWYTEEQSMLGLVNITVQGRSQTIKIKILPQSSDEAALLQSEDAQLYILGSVLTQQRMYMACTLMPDVNFMHQLLRGHLSPIRSVVVSRYLRATPLNISQQQAIQRFAGVQTGLHLLQGPPGTGKTTTIVTLLSILAAQGQRVLVCAPSNKAIQVIALRFLASYPDHRMVLTGTVAKLLDALRPIFLETWIKDSQNTFTEVLRLLQTISLIMLARKNADARKIFLDNTIETIQQQLIIFNHRLQLMLPFQLSLDLYAHYLTQYKQIVQRLPEKRWNTFNDPSAVASTELFRTHTERSLAAINKNLTEFTQKLSGVTAVIFLNYARIIFSTLSVAGRASMLDMEAVDTLVVDEAGQTVEAETLIALLHKPKKCLLVGDTKQLPATVKSEFAKEKKYDRSLMSRLIEDLREPYDMLTVQYRMHSEIRLWPGRQYYENRLTDAESIATRPTPTSLYRVFNPYMIFDIKGNESSRGHSFANTEEAKFVTRLATYLKNNHATSATTIGVITFYAGQVETLSAMFRSIPQLRQIKISTVDGFQGDECDYIIISCVRANPHGNVGFVQDFRRLNVALTRARHGLFVVGNVAALIKKNTHDVSLMLHDALARGVVYPASMLTHVQQPVPAPVVQSRPVSAPTTNTSIVRNTVLCRFFIAGNASSCRNGINCQFYHDRLQGPLRRNGHF